MNLRRVTVYVRDSWREDEVNVAAWTPEETELVLRVGAMALRSAKESLSQQSYVDVIREVERKYEEKLSEVEMSVVVQGERAKWLEQVQEMEVQKRVSEVRAVWDGVLEGYRKEREEMRDRMVKLEVENQRLREMERSAREETEARMKKEWEQEQEVQVEKRVGEVRALCDVMVENYRKERQELKERMLRLEFENGKLREMDREVEGRIEKEALGKVQRELNVMRQMLSEKDKQVATHREMFERSMGKLEEVTQKRDVASIGKIGEGQFRELALRTFRDFEGFQLREVCAIGGLGDFHLQFKEMSVLVDAKLYTNKVNSTSREKIKRDLMNNEHMQFAWLVSMDTSVDRFDKAPFMFEWLNTEKCVCYVNNLRGQEDAGELLRSVWYCCRALRQVMDAEGAERGELSILKEREMRMRDLLSKMSKNHRERDTLVGQLRKNFDRTDELMRELLNEETAAVVKDCYRVVVDWWNEHMEECGEGGVLKSTEVWTQFKRDRRRGGVEGMEVNGFKETLCGFLGGECVLKPKVRGGALEIRGWKWKGGGVVEGMN